jgi:DNA mismatch repair protein MutL
MAIRHLSETVINRIAAGEVIERPASVVKELVENALDAGAGRLDIAIAGGGLAFIRVTDDGAGMDARDLAMSVKRHCTSKLGDDIDDIRSLGFRGEALPSIGSVGRLTIRSRREGSESGHEIAVTGGRVAAVRPVAANRGTLVEVRDLFFATPARLKFMKGERAEASAVAETVRRIAIAFPGVRFTLSGPERTMLDLAACAGHDERVAQVLGREFADNALAIEAEREGVRLSGFASIPAYSRANAQHQYLYVNGRPVRDRWLAGALRGAYADVLARDRHAVAALFLQLDPALVDVNVHPAKADVRFRDPGLVRGLIVGSVREALARSGVRAATTGAEAMMAAFHVDNAGQGWQPRQAAPGFDAATSFQRPFGFGEGPAAPYLAPAADARAGAAEPAPQETARPLGAARAQVHENYIVAQTDSSLIIVDQHAAHERLVYESLKAALASRFGLTLERFGPGAVAVRATPAMLGEVDVPQLVRDLADEIAETDTVETLKERLDAIAATMACHGSVRSGRRLLPDEMNALLRQMEATPGSGTCNHGRPTYIELKLTDIERLFGRR